jgi:hypothetical protein
MSLSNNDASTVASAIIPLQNDDGQTVTLVAKYGKERITLDELHPKTTILEIKELLQEHTRILPKRQKLVGLVAANGGARGVVDSLTVAELKLKKDSSNSSAAVSHPFILMGTPEEEIFVDPSDRDDLPGVVDDFELDFNAGSQEWLNHVANAENLKTFTEKTPVHVMNAPRPGYPLLVLDLDHTLLDFSSRLLQQGGESMKTTRRFVHGCMAPLFFIIFLTFNALSACCNNIRRFDYSRFNETSFYGFVLDQLISAL